MRGLVEGITAISAVCLALLTVFQVLPSHDSRIFHSSKRVVQETANHKDGAALSTAMKPIPSILSPVNAKFSLFPFYASAATVPSSTSSFPTSERSIDIHPNDPLLNSRNEQPNLQHPYHQIHDDFVHPSFLSTGTNHEMIILSDQEWKKKVQTSRGRLHALYFQDQDSSTRREEENDQDTYSSNDWMKYVENVYDADLGFYPPYFDTFTGERLRIEMLYYQTHQKKFREEAILEMFLYEMGMKNLDEETLKEFHWFDESVPICDWKGVVCGVMNTNEDHSQNRNVMEPSITQLILPNFSLRGSLPTELAFLSNLQVLHLNGNNIYGSIPFQLSHLHRLRSLDLGANQISGVIPAQIFSKLHHLKSLCLHSNQLIGILPEQLYYPTQNIPKSLLFLDLSWNMFVGTIPSKINDLCRTSHLVSLNLEGNMISGTIPTTLGDCTSMKELDIHSNHLKGTIPSELGELENLTMMILSNNNLDGTIPSQIFQLSELQTLVLSDNHLSGTFPEGYWGNMAKLLNFVISNNLIDGKLPSDLARMSNIQYININSNALAGSIPKEVGKLESLQVLDLSSNNFSGVLPHEIGEANMLMKLNVTNNGLTGTIPLSLCNNAILNGGNALDYGCDSIACPAGTYSDTGAATMNDMCRECNFVDNNVLGRTHCGRNKDKILGDQSIQSLPNGDMDGDGKISQREILRLLYLYTSMGEKGIAWNKNINSIWHKWKDLKVHECDLPGIVCKNGDVVNIELREVDLCSNRYESKSEGNCLGLPTELGLLHYLEVLDLSHSPNLLSNIPSEIGRLQHLKELDLSQSPNLAGSIPAEIGHASSLITLNISGSGMEGSIPEEIGNLEQLEKLDLSLNLFSGSIPESVGDLKNVKEILISRSSLNGTIPGSIGNLVNLENLELYGNRIGGSLPSSLGDCQFLMRIDVYNNMLTGTIPAKLTMIPLLQIAHLKENFFTGTIPQGFANHPLLSWLDLSSNQLQGKIPKKFGMSASLKNIHLGGNRFQGPIPDSLCTNKKVNHGSTVRFGCDAILCPVGMHSTQNGYASNDSPCQKCIDGETTLYFGGLECHQYTQRDYLKMFYDIMKGDQWEHTFSNNWKDDEVSECEWAGVSCDKDGLIDGLSFPIAATSLSQH